MIPELKKPHTAIFSGMTGCGKTELALNLLETAYAGFFDQVVIFCPTFTMNSTYSRPWVKNDKNVKIFTNNWAASLHHLKSIKPGSNTLFLIDDVVGESFIKKKSGALIKLATSGRHFGIYVWFLIQVYNSLTKDIRRQAKMLYIFYPKEKNEFKLITEENYVIETQRESSEAFCFLKENHHGCLIIKMEHPRCYSLYKNQK